MVVNPQDNMTYTFEMHPILRLQAQALCALNYGSTTVTDSNIQGIYDFKELQINQKLTRVTYCPEPEVSFDTSFFIKVLIIVMIHMRNLEILLSFEAHHGSHFHRLVAPHAQVFNAFMLHHGLQKACYVVAAGIQAAKPGPKALICSSMLPDHVVDQVGHHLQQVLLSPKASRGNLAGVGTSAAVYGHLVGKAADLLEEVEVEAVGSQLCL